jgi:hypothetical protein
MTDANKPEPRPEDEETYELDDALETPESETAATPFYPELGDSEGSTIAAHELQSPRPTADEPGADQPKLVDPAVAARKREEARARHAEQMAQQAGKKRRSLLLLVLLIIIAGGAAWLIWGPFGGDGQTEPAPPDSPPAEGPVE